MEPCEDWTRPLRQLTENNPRTEVHHTPFQLGQVPNLTDEQTAPLEAVVEEFQDVVAWTEDQVGCTFIQAPHIDSL